MNSNTGKTYSKFSATFITTFLPYTVCTMQTLCNKLYCLHTNRRNFKLHNASPVCYTQQITLESVNKVMQRKRKRDDKTGGVRVIQRPCQQGRIKGNL